jgi:predicted dehydrogenase
MKSKLRVGIIGCGLIGKRRAEIASSHQLSTCTYVADLKQARAKELADQLKCRWSLNREDLIGNPEIDVIVISTPNRWLVPLAKEALKNKKHVLIEKPMGRNLEEANDLWNTSKGSSSLLKIGFNHRYHPALRAAQECLRTQTLGKPLFIRAVYGHGGRPGYDQEWRADPEISGGGELLDQGVHLADLIQWFFGMPAKISGKTSKYVWATDRVEDNAFAQLSWTDGRVAQFHTSWTQWKNRFELQIYGDQGAVEIQGLGGSYGPETLIEHTRSKAGGPPHSTTKVFPEGDQSWESEWAEFVEAIRGNGAYMGTPKEGLAAMKIVDAIYRSDRENKIVEL